ncbi:LysR family transcriptional regulator [Azospirillum sp. TSO22-1]|uniref:LysR family transcriptional regulator n=1 Tax=Azospirillum sp. TSO22-1 TaxID=716789 RepID=UPI000D621BF5|nr:LysR family transcriptional regulator [Azospirillum sp. TSO22-1]PWC56745.1 hypothetical protein TSO221_01145 [Azospirillum sp. TSO22-1]
MRSRRPTLVELEALRATIADGTTANAARRLGRSQSSVSRALAQLEARLGVPLFERAGREIRPTAEALAVDRELDGVFAALDRVAAGMDAATGQRLVLAVPPAFALSLVPAALVRFAAAHPAVTTQVDIALSGEVVSLVAEGRADLGLTDSSPLHAGIRLEPFRRSRMACVLPAGHPLAARSVVEPRDLADVPFIALTRRHSMRARLDALFAEAGVARRIVAEASSAIVALELVCVGLGVTLMNPLSLADRDDPRLALLRFEPEMEYHTAFVLPRQGAASPHARRFQRAVTTSLRRDPWSEAC